MATPEEFSRRIGELGVRVTKNADKTVRKVAMAIDQTVVMATPVDTGRARANWIAALGFPSSTVTDDKDPGGGKAIAQAAGVAAAYNGDAHRAIHITNNLPYIQRLDAGSSKQAPAGFVRSAVARGAAAVKGAKLLSSGS